MCGRFALSAMLTDIAEEFSTSAEPDRTLPVDWNIKPTQDIYIVKNQEITIASSRHGVRIQTMHFEVNPKQSMRDQNLFMRNQRSEMLFVNVDVSFQRRVTMNGQQS
jgi:putative SOS response-associated peptidase YedK